MSGNFQHTSGHIFCEFDVRRGTPIHPCPSAGLYMLNIPITFDVKTSESPRFLTSVSGAIFLNSLFIAELKPQDGNFIIQQSDKHSLQTQQYFTAIFQRESINTIEAMRTSADLNFDFRLNGNIVYFNSTNNQPFNILHAKGNLSHQMLQSEWIDILNKWKYAPAMNLAIVLNFENPALSKAGDFIHQAQKFYLERQWPQVVSECRKAIDVATDLLNTKKQSLKILIENKHENNINERLLISLLSIKQVLDPASHGDSNSVKITWTQEDALYAIRMTASILMRAAKEPIA